MRFIPVVFVKMLAFPSLRLTDRAYQFLALWSSADYTIQSRTFVSES